MHVNKWHGAVDAGRAKGKKGSTVDHWILVTEETFTRLEGLATKRKQTVADLVDHAINAILDGVKAK